MIAFEVTPRTAAGLVKYHEVKLDASRSYFPGSPYSPIVGFYADWLPGNLYGGYRHTILQLMRTGWQRVGVEHGKCDGTSSITWRTIYVEDIAPWTDIPWSYRRYGGPRPIFIRGSLLVKDRQRTARVNRSGVPIEVTCPRLCIVDSALQVTRYRARRIGLPGPHRRTRANLALASNTNPAFVHRLRLRPDPALRRPLRRQARVPARVLVIVRALNGAKHTIPAQVELLGGRRR